VSLQAFNTIDVARLEVAVPPAGLVNLVPNPDAALGAWGWMTSNASAVLEREPSATADLFSYSCTVATSWFETTPMPMTEGYYAAASIVLPPTGAGPSTPFTMRFEWLDAEQNSITFSAVTGAMSGYGTYALGPQLAPAGTRFMKLTFDMASAGEARFTGVKASSAATAAELGSSITNLHPNPSAEVDLYGHEAWRGTITRSAGVAYSGSASIRGEASATGLVVGTPYGTGSGGVWHAVTPGKDYTFQYRAQAATTGRRLDTLVEWWSGATLIVDQRLFGLTPDAVNTWTRSEGTFTAPAGATHARFAAWVDSPGTGEVHWLDGFMLTEGRDTPGYFDGSTPDAGTITYAWQGTAHASASTMTDSTLGSIVPASWRNVLGPTHTIKVVRESLNVGTLEADVLDSSIDPATTATVRPGAAARLLALVDGVWEPVFTGKLDTIDVEYDVKSRPVKPPRVRLTAHDNTAGLSSLARPNGVAAVDDLFAVVEGANVPWEINGYTGLPAGSPTAVSTNDNATALDQIALTRDTALAHGHVDRKGVLRVADTPDPLPPAVATYAEARYSDLGLAFASTECINAVEVDVLTLTADGKTETVTYGPYEDAESINEWGRRARRFTVHGIASAAVPAYADRILASNATPGVSVSQIRMPMRSTTDLADALRDLGDLVRVTNAAKAVDSTVRVTRVEHTIEADPAKWMLTLGFAKAESVAAPTVAPPLVYNSSVLVVDNPVGEVRIYAGASEPPGWLFCRGQACSSVDYPQLFAVIGYTFGGSGGTFYLPNMKARSPIGVGGTADTGSVGNAYALGQKYGHEALAKHAHSVYDPSHNHSPPVAVTYGGNAGAQRSIFATNSPFWSLGDGNNAVTYAGTGIGIYEAGSGDTGNVHPVLGMNYIIRTHS